MDSEGLKLNVPQTFKIIAPDYFVSHSAINPNAERLPPEIVIASVISIKICKTDGTAIGSYLNKK
jgi:hypothetical protein